MMRKTKKSGKRSLVCMQWNILANGLANDGFVLNSYDSDFISDCALLKENVDKMYKEGDNDYVVTDKKMLQKLSNLAAQKENSVDHLIAEVGVSGDDVATTPIRNFYNMYQDLKDKHNFVNKVKEYRESFLEQQNERILNRIKHSDPDIITLQEVDMGEGKQYDYLTSELSEKYNYLTREDLKMPGTTKETANTTISNLILWKKRLNRTTGDIKTIKYSDSPVFQRIVDEPNGGQTILQKSKYGAVAVRLVTNRKKIWVVCAHLSSGDKPSEKVERKYEQKALKSFIDTLTLREDIILGMDGNCSIAELRVHKGGLFDEKSRTSLTNYTDLLNDTKKDGTRQEHVTVNKMRGMLTSQLNKLGDYQLANIDYLSWRSRSLTFKECSKLPTYLASVVELLNKKKNDLIFIEKLDSIDPFMKDIVPSEENPSDHLPVVVTLQY
jgi:exonuclease III